MMMDVNEVNYLFMRYFISVIYIHLTVFLPNA